MDPAEATFSEDDRALHARRAGADDEDVAVARCGRLETLGMPAAPVLLAGGRVLGAARCDAVVEAFETQTLQPMHSRISP